MATSQAAKADRTIVVCGVPEGCLSDDVMTDILTIHFQKRRNKGADVEKVVYPTSTSGVAYVTFEDKQAAENVLLKVEHSLEDRRLRRAYPLKVSSYGNSIFTCVTCDLDLSTFGEKATLEDLLEDLKERLTALNYGPLQPSGQITVQGPFPAIRTLQRMLLFKAKPCVLSEQDAKRKERAPDPRLDPCRLSNTGSPLEPSSGLVRHAPEDGAIVVTDTDIYSYLKKFHGKQYQRCLKQCGVSTLECLDGEVTTIYLSNAKSGPSRLEEAKGKVEAWLGELQDSLRKKRLPLDGFRAAEKRKYQQAWETLSARFPHVLAIHYPSHVDLIGSSADVYAFAQDLDRMVGNVQNKPWR